MMRIRGRAAGPALPGTGSPAGSATAAPGAAPSRPVDASGGEATPGGSPVAGIAAAGMTSLVGWLVVVEFVSGIIQGYYTPLYTDIARHLAIHDADVNIFEAAQLMVSAVCVPIFAKLGDTLGYRRMLLWSSVVAAVGSWGIVVMPNYLTFTIAWAVQGAYVAWLPLDVALISARARQFPDAHRLTNKGAGVIVAALQAGAITGAVLGGQLGVFAPTHMPLVLGVPAVLVTVVVLVVATRVPEAPEIPGGRLDLRGAVLVSLSLLAVGTGLTLVRLQGLTSPWAWGLVVVGLVLLWAFVRAELQVEDPLIDVRVLRGTQLWPVVVTSGLFGVSVLGAQGSLSTFARTDPEVYGYGLGLSSIGVSVLILGYVLATFTGALLHSRIALVLGGRRSLVLASLLVATGYLSLLVLHTRELTMLAGMVVAGLGSGALVAALPAAAASAAPHDRTGVATGLTNTTKTVGGMVASAAFAVALLSGNHDTLAGEAGTAGSFGGYMTVWIVCGVTALVSVGFLLMAPAGSFEGAPDAVDAAEPTGDTNGGGDPDEGAAPEAAPVGETDLGAPA